MEAADYWLGEVPFGQFYLTVDLKEESLKVQDQNFTELMIFFLEYSAELKKFWCFSWVKEIFSNGTFWCELKWSLYFRALKNKTVKKSR